LVQRGVRLAFASSTFLVSALPTEIFPTFRS
jgi:hypothetical protein